NCGGCGNVCSAAHGTPACFEGVCGIAVCDAGYADCDGDPANGCEVDTGTDASNCGACGNVCKVSNGMGTCSGGTCTTAMCDAGYADCDGNPANGCETNVASDVNNCGSCGHA